MSLIKLIVAILLLSTIQTVEPDLKDKIINVTVELKNDVVYSLNNLVESVKSHLNNSSDYFNDTKTFIDNASDVVEDKVVEWWPSVKKVNFRIHIYHIKQEKFNLRFNKIIIISIVPDKSWCGHSVWFGRRSHWFRVVLVLPMCLWFHDCRHQRGLSGRLFPVNRCQRRHSFRLNSVTDSTRRWFHILHYC